MNYNTQSATQRQRKKVQMFKVSQFLQLLRFLSSSCSRNLPDELTTIHEILPASHIARIVRQQQDSLADHLLRLGEAFEWDVRGLVRAHGGVHAGRLRRVDVPGAERVDADAVRGPFGRETFCDRGDGGFRGVVEYLQGRKCRVELVLV